MKQRRLLAVPVDARPAVRQHVVDLMAAGGWQLDVPPLDMLGHLREPAARDALRDWVMQHAAQASGFVLSLDMLVYGGLVPSRFMPEPLPLLVARLALLDELKALYPDKLLYAFAATMRLSNSKVADEEKPYWAEHGEDLWAWSFHSDRAAQRGQAQDQAAAQAAMARVPQAIRDDYLATRARNHAVNLATLAAVQQGLIDRLVLPQDDTAEFGFNVAERRTLQAAVAEAGLQARVKIYPGADEVLHTLCAHQVMQLQGQRLRVAISAHQPERYAALRPLYEDRPLADSIPSQIEAVGAELVMDVATADVVLAVHTQGTAQGDWAMQRPLPEPGGINAAWLAQLAALVAAGRNVAVADLAYANGGDPWLVQALMQALPLRELGAYAGWNTAGNTLGSALAQALLAHGQRDSAAHRHNLALRLVEDMGWQAMWRQTVRLAMPSDGALDAQALRQQVAALVLPQANAWLAPLRLGWHVAEVQLPWQRTFEIGLTLAQDPAP
jgi:Protein of unknown function (DUF4127)